MERKIMKRIISFMLAIIMVVSIVISTDWLTVTASNSLFTDDFSSNTLTGWNNSTVGEVKSGKYYLKGQELNSIVSVSDRLNNKISADVAVNIGADSTGTIQTSMASLVIGSSKELNMGYEFSIGVAKDGSTFARLYLRGTEETSRILEQQSKDIPGTEKGKIVVGQEYKLMMGCYNGLIQCFINNELVFSFEDSTYTSGYCGVKTVWSKSSFDNVSVEKIEDKKVKSISLENVPAQVSLLGKLKFDVVATYEGDFHQPEIIPADDSRLVISGFERSIGKKNVTVKYAGKSTEFTVDVVKETGDKVIYSDDFATKREDDYKLYETVWDDYNVSYIFKTENGSLRGIVPSLPQGYDKQVTAIATLDVDEVDQLQLYYATVDATIHKDIPTPTTRRATATLSAVVDANGDTYRLRVNSQGKIELLKGETAVLSKLISDVPNATFAMGRKFNLTMCISSNIIICKYNGIDVFYYTGADLSSYTSKIAIRAQSGDVTFDDLKVCAMEEYATDAITSMQIMTISTQEEIKTFKGRVLDPSKFYLLVTYTDGSNRVIGFTDDMLENYDADAKKNQYVTIRYGKAKTYLTFQYSEYLFYDDFTKIANPLWRYITAKSLTMEVKNGGLKVDWTGDSDGTNSTARIEVQGSDEWTDYSASVDVTFDQAMTKSTLPASYYTLMLRRAGNTYYDYRLCTRAGSITISLYEYIDGKGQEVCSYTANTLKMKLGEGKALANGATYNMKALCKGDTIYLYLNDILLGTYTNESDNAPKQGYVGMKLAKASGTIDNFIVEEKGPYRIVKLGVEGLENNVFEVYEGFDIEAYDYILNCYDADGTVLPEILKPEMLSQFDNLEPGIQNITITAHGVTQKAAVRVLKREDYIKKVEKSLDDINLSSITVDDVEFVEEILGRYDELSPYEITKLSDKVVEKAEKTRIQIQNLRYPDIAEDDILVKRYFTEEDECSEDEWPRGAYGTRGEWFFVNGTYRQEQLSHGISAESTKIFEPIYGEISYVSARIKLLESDMYAGVGLNISSEGRYVGRVKMDNYDEDGNLVPMFQVLKDDVRVYSKALAGQGVTVEQDKWFDVTLTCVEGVVSAYLNGVLIFAFDDSEEIGAHTEGRAAVTICNGNGKFDNFIVRGVAKDEPASKVIPTPTEYADDFEDEATNGDPNYWVESNVTDDWKVYASDNNKVYGTTGTKEETNTWLHVFEKDSTVSMDFKYQKRQKDAIIGFYVRRSPETAYVKVGYDVTQKKWYVIDTQGERGADINTIYSEKEYSLKENENHHIEIQGDGKMLTVKVDGETIFEKVKVTQYGYGRIGVYSKNAAFYIDNVKCEFPNGDIPQDGITEYILNPEFYDAGADLENLDGDNMIAFGNYGSYYSTDRGQTFSVIGGASADSKDVVEAYKDLTGAQGYKSAVKLHDGSYLYVHTYEMVAKKSTDNGKTWKTVGDIASGQMKDEKERRRIIFHNNSLVEYQLEDGTWRIYLPVAIQTYENVLSTSSNGAYTVIYYSDDGGVTWKQSKGSTNDAAINYIEGKQAVEWNEMKLVQCTDGTMRLYLTHSAYGCMQYTVSHDNGMTWEGHYQVPEMQCARSSFSVIRDEDGTYYIVWVNNNPITKGATYSRTRLSVAKSTDGKTWEFLCDLERMTEEMYGNNVTVTTPLMQIVDPSIHVDGDYLYVTYGCSDGKDTDKIVGAGSNYHNRLRVQIARIEKDKLATRKWDASTISDMLFTKSIEVTKPIKVRFGLGDLFSYAGGEVTETKMDGTTEVVDTRNFYLYEEPDMFALGKQTVVLYNSHGMQATYEIEVVKKYTVTWNVTGEGLIEPQVNSVLEGDKLEVKIGAKSFFKKAIVTVNGEKIRLRNGKLICEDVKEDLEINVSFTSKGILDYLILMIPLLVSIGCIVCALICGKKKIKPKELLALIKSKLRRGKKDGSK